MQPATSIAEVLLIGNTEQLSPIFLQDEVCNLRAWRHLSCCRQIFWYWGKFLHPFWPRASLRSLNSILARNQYKNKLFLAPSLPFLAHCGIWDCAIYLFFSTLPTNSWRLRVVVLYSRLEKQRISLLLNGIQLGWGLDPKKKKLGWCSGDAQFSLHTQAPPKLRVAWTFMFFNGWRENAPVMPHVPAFLLLIDPNIDWQASSITGIPKFFEIFISSGI